MVVASSLTIHWLEPLGMVRVPPMSANGTGCSAGGEMSSAESSALWKVSAFVTLVPRGTSPNSTRSGSYEKRGGTTSTCTLTGVVGKRGSSELNVTVPSYESPRAAEGGAAAVTITTVVGSPA